KLVEPDDMRIWLWPMETDVHSFAGWNGGARRINDDRARPGGIIVAGRIGWIRLWIPDRHWRRLVLRDRPPDCFQRNRFGRKCRYGRIVGDLRVLGTSLHQLDELGFQEKLLRPDVVVVCKVEHHRGKQSASGSLRRRLAGETKELLRNLEVPDDATR